MKPVLILSLCCLSLSLLSCNETVTASPFLDGSFSGTYRVLVASEPSGNPLTLEMSLSKLNVTAESYSFRGSATLDGTTYSVEGEEKANNLLTYQALPPLGDTTIQFNDSNGETKFSICATVGYGSAAETTLRDVPMWQGNCNVAEPGEPFAEATFTKD